ncbi:MafI family immunity protein [Kitasatospora viridis]|uniref:MafI family immunity protein n=1 Tax=Kitasatospora viridis TaxID=281105 RepID=A0A561UMM1_9ACTN|nr:MafI family immunity protein [Kitasatospora viridis]TWG00587.1 hypothetical protein FHX73_114467 [Kitasatospora viridis]
MIDDKIRELAKMLSSHVPAFLVDDLLTYMREDERELGLEILCEKLYDELVPLSSAEIEMILELGEMLDLPADMVGQVAELGAEE